jgi:hypothetical protein
MPRLFYKNAIFSPTKGSLFVCYLESNCIQLHDSHDKLPALFNSNITYKLDAENTITLKTLQTEYKTLSKQKPRTQRQFNLKTYIISKKYHYIISDNTLYPTTAIWLSTLLLTHSGPTAFLEIHIQL